MRIVRIADLPALDAALTRFDLWWRGLSGRERVLITILALLLAGVVLVYGVIKPLQIARAAALADIRTYETLNARIVAAGRLDPAGSAPRRSGTPAEIVTGSATGFGLVANAEPIPGGVRATVADGSYDSVMAWLADLAATSPLAATRVEIVRRPTPGRVSATVDFAG